ncbi:MAG: diguanylate cyclase [Deltaproteobacteria bacterium]|nr:diguanylate cyclase [Deltaproteobacteria bacterium]
MKCSKCQFENLENAKFCSECGNKLEIHCPKCGGVNPLSSKFCSECGHRIALPKESLRKELSYDEKIARIQKYLPGGLTEKILSQRDRIEGERKQVTVMFCDMEGYTGLTEKLGPEEAYSLMDKVYEILIRKVHEYEGTVNELTGDGIMALFGAPIALEDAPQRAIRSALAIHREMSKFSDQLKSESRMPFIKMRIGIHTGPVIVGTLGNDLRVEFKAVGDTVNLASRMEGLAEPGTTFVTEDIFNLTEGFFRFEALGEKQIKGKKEPVKVYQVIVPSTRRTRFDVSAERGLTPFVGRERELELLLDGFTRAKSGKGQAFSIVSEAGCGKSRLLYEFRKAIVNENVTFLEGKCLSYSRGVAYHPVIDILKSNFDIHEGEGDQETREKVKRGLEIMKVDEPSTLPYLLELLSVKDSGIDKISMSPEAKKDRIIEAIKRIVLRGSEIRPLVMAFEDLHWIDKSSEDVVRSHLESIPGARILLIFTYRPEFVHTWGAKSYHNQLTLHRLSNRESFEMATHILGTKEIEKPLEELILEKTEGVPFFIEEFIKSLRDLKIIEKRDNTYCLSKDIHQLTIPSTIQDVIMARVDSLPEGAKEVLQTGSVIEREFGYELIRRIMDFPEQELFSNLSVLKDSELLYERGIYPQSNYIFKHTLTREVVKDSILTKRKKILHEDIGKAIEELHRDNLSEYYEVLVEHYFLSENYSKGAEYSRLASRKAEKAASLNDAITYTKKRVTSLERLPQIDDVQKQIIDGRTALGLYMIQMNYHTEAQEAIGPIIDLAIKHDYKRRLCQIYTVLGANYLFMENDCLKAFKVLEEALKISGEIKDYATSLFASYWFGAASGWNCEFERSAQYIQKALDINIATRTLWGISAIKSDLAYFSYFFSGKINLGFQTTQEAVLIAEESGDIYSKAIANIMYGLFCHGKGLLEEAEKHLLKGLEFSERINLPSRNMVARYWLGETYFEMGDFPRSKEHYEKGILISENDRTHPSWANLEKVNLARTKVLDKEKDVDLESLYAYSRNNKLKVIEGWFQRYIGEILLNIDDQHLSEAEHWVQKAIEADQRNRMMFHLGKDYALYSDLFRQKGDRLKAQENLGKAIEILKECGADGWVEKYEKELTAIS